MRIGVLGGTFDPVHIGHLVVAEEARDRLELGEVLFVPASQPQLKPDYAITSAGHRLQMLGLAISDQPCFKVSAVEIERSGPTYTVDTMAELRRRYGRGDELFFILGWDSLARLAEWREPSRLIQLCCLVAVPRPGCARPDLDALEASIPGIFRRLILMEKPLVDISASAIRERVARGLSIQSLVPEKVAAYIKQHKLYLSQ